MKKYWQILTLGLATTQLTHAAAVVGKPAPEFRLRDTTGKEHTNADFKGKWVVLEWFNKDCPYVQKHYGVQNMQNLQKEFSKKGVVWVSVISSAPKKQGHMTTAEAAALFGSAGGPQGAALALDEKGEVGKAFGAKTTPHIFVLNPEGAVAYAGAIDDNDSSDAAVIPKSKNYLKEALDEGMAGKPITVASSKAYGCSVKY